jgi:hypothetical protein
VIMRRSGSVAPAVLRGMVLGVLLALPACGSCGGSSQPIGERSDGGGAKVLIDEFDGGRTTYRARNRPSPIYLLEDAGPAPR